MVLYSKLINLSYNLNSASVPNTLKKDTQNLENVLIENEDVHEVEEALRWRYCTKKWWVDGYLYFPKLFVTVIYVVLLFVACGTIFTQLMIFAKGK